MGVQNAERAFARLQLEGQMIRIQSTRCLRDQDSNGMLHDQGMQLLGTGLFEVAGTYIGHLSDGVAIRS